MGFPKLKMGKLGAAGHPKRPTGAVPMIYTCKHTHNHTYAYTIHVHIHTYHTLHIDSLMVEHQSSKLEVLCSSPVWARMLGWLCSGVYTLELMPTGVVT